MTCALADKKCDFRQGLQSTGCSPFEGSHLALLKTYVHVRYTARAFGKNCRQFLWGKVVGCKSDYIFEVACLDRNSWCGIIYRDVVECAWNGKTTSYDKHETVPMSLIRVKRYAKTRRIRNIRIYYKKYRKFVRDWRLWYDYLLDAGFDLPYLTRPTISNPLGPYFGDTCLQAFMNKKLPKNFISPVRLQPRVGQAGLLMRTVPVTTSPCARSRKSISTITVRS
eukprot:TRINITY_DN10463_c0_g1_i1.p1 TRINITY_DN10463_c0_g1~~TRINITY_DN10463_c0_g1_i1.p1  ORF type:complete len:224 (+),score=3.18 TRINITY_DN10463_c0_g1_i1:503-1174(+)